MRDVQTRCTHSRAATQQQYRRRTRFTAAAPVLCPPCRVCRTGKSNLYITDTFLARQGWPILHTPSPRATQCWRSRSGFSSITKSSDGTKNGLDQSDTSLRCPSCLRAAVGSKLLTTSVFIPAREGLQSFPSSSLMMTVSKTGVSQKYLPGHPLIWVCLDGQCTSVGAVPPIPTKKSSPQQNLEHVCSF